MTRELIEDFAKIVKPFVQKRLLEENFEGMGEQDKAEFGRDFDEIISLAIKGLESSTWISVTERLPKEKTAVLLSCDDMYLARLNPCIGWRNGNYWHTFSAKGSYLVKYPIAWMPLPEPYKGGE